MKDKRTSIDGFVPRRSGSRLGELHNNHKTPVARAEVVNKSIHSGNNTQATVGVARRNMGVGRSDIDESLRDIDGDRVGIPQKRTRRQRKADRKLKQSRTRRIVKWFVLLLVVVAVVLAGYIGYRAMVAGGNIFKGNIFDIFTQTNRPLQQDSNGRSNILILGTSEDDPGHQAGNLTDSMMILSVDQNKKNAYMISIPRDLYVQYHQACDAGYQGRINVYYGCVTKGTSTDAQREALAKTASFIGGIVGMDIQYGVNVNYTVMRDVVNAVGGSVTLKIESRDPRGVMDSNFDWKCGASYYTKLKNCPPAGHYIQYPNGMVTLDAEHTLYLAQARGDTAPTYGFEQSNFDREKNQQKIVRAIRDKAMSVGVLANFGKVSGILDSLGSNLRTTFATNEVKTLVSLAQSIKDTDINSISLIDGDVPVMTTGNVDGQSIVEPAAGLYDYSKLQAVIKKQLSTDGVIRESAPIAIYNGSGIAGVAQTQADKLKTQNFTISIISSAPDGKYSSVEIYQIGTGNTATKDKLEKLFSVTAKTTTPPVTANSATKFIVIFGNQPSSGQ